MPASTGNRFSSAIISAAGRCTGPTRRELLHVGGLSLFGLSSPALLRGQRVAASNWDRSFGRAKSCIVLFLLGGPPQHETWDPKPNAPSEIRGDLRAIASNVPGIAVGELMPRVAQHMQRICILRGVATDSNAHSSSGYELLTGHAHPAGKMVDNLPIRPSDWPSIGAVLKRLQPKPQELPVAVTLPQRIFNNGYIYWPGQDAGFLGRAWDPWLLTCDPTAEDFQVREFALPAEVPTVRIDARRSLLAQLDRQLDPARRSAALAQFDQYTQQALDLLSTEQARQAFDLRREPAQVRDRYGRHKFGQSVLLARRLVEAGVRLVQVNWAREPSEISSSNPAWDTHQKNTERLKTVLMPPMDCACAALLDDLAQRGLLEETLVVVLGEFGRTPRINARGGRDHWGHVFSVALAGGGIRGGQVYGASDSIGGRPRDGRVRAQDLTATLFHSLGHAPHTAILDALRRPLPISTGEVIRHIY